MNTIILSLALSLTALAAAPAFAGDAHAGHGASAATAAPLVVAQAGAALTDGEVRKIDKEQGKITLRHGEIKNLDMSAMTMVFRVKEPALLDKVQVGDKVRFSADKIGGEITVTGIEANK